MINLILKQKGAATLLITTILLLTSTLIVLFSANYSLMQQKITSNLARNNQAFEAAEAGLEFAIPYLQQNSNTILVPQGNGYIQNYSDSNITNVTLANNSRFSVVYSNPVANNYELILITSTGTSDDNTSTRVVNQLVQFGSLLNNPPTNPLTSKGAINVGGNANIVNMESNTTVRSAAGITFSGSGQTTTATGGSNASTNGGDTQQDISSIEEMTNEQFFQSYFGTSSATIKNSAQYYYSNSSDTNYSSTLDGKTGTTIWIDQSGGSAKLSGNTTIGSATNPVLLVVNGDLEISGNVTIYGFIYVLGEATATTAVSGNANIQGGLVSAAGLDLQGSMQLTFSTPVLEALQNLAAMRYYAKIPGGWKDF